MSDLEDLQRLQAQRDLLNAEIEELEYKIAAKGKPVLDLPLPANDSGAANVREYLEKLLYALWNEGESFSGKRPFGNSGWEHNLIDPIVDAGLAADEVEAERLVFKAIGQMCAAPGHSK